MVDLLSIVAAPGAIASAVMAPAAVASTLVQAPAQTVSSFERSVAQDLSGSRYWFLRFPDRIKRIDVSLSPFVVRTYMTSQPLEDWAIRASLTYS